MQGRPLRRGELTAAQAQENQWTHLFKVILVGREGVGKSALLRRFDDDTYKEDTKQTIGADFVVQTLALPKSKGSRASAGTLGHPEEEERVKIQLWDTAGQERFQSVVLNYYRGAHGVLLVFSLDKRSTFDSCKQLHTTLMQAKLDSDFVGILVGNKRDLAEQREVGTEEAEKLASQWGWNYWETSAKCDSEKTWDLFYTLVQEMYSKYSRFEGTTIPSITTPRGTPIVVGADLMSGLSDPHGSDRPTANGKSHCAC